MKFSVPRGVAPTMYFPHVYRFFNINRHLPGWQLRSIAEHVSQQLAACFYFYFRSGTLFVHHMTFQGL